MTEATSATVRNLTPEMSAPDPRGSGVEPIAEPDVDPVVDPLGDSVLSDSAMAHRFLGARLRLPRRRYDDAPCADSSVTDGALDMTCAELDRAPALLVAPARSPTLAAGSGMRIEPVVGEDRQSGRVDRSVEPRRRVVAAGPVPVLRRTTVGHPQRRALAEPPYDVVAPTGGHRRR